MRARKTALAAAVTLALAAWQHPVYAQYTYQLNPLYTLVIMEKGDEIVDEDDGSTETVNENLDPSYLTSFTQASDYWSSLFGNYLANSHAAVMRITPNSAADDNASAYSPPHDSGTYAGLTALSAALFHNYFGESGRDYSELLAQITVDHGSFYAEGLDWYLGTMTNLSSSGVQSDLSSTLVHELTHALGLFADHTEADTGGIYSLKYESNFSKGLVDAQGNRLTATSKLVTADNIPTDGSSYFVVESTTSNISGAYFTGTNTAKVLNGALIAWPDNEDIKVAGVPVNGFEPTQEGGYAPEFSHLELKNGQMSHQSYRNYNVLMEAELAVLQDSGVPMDRRNLFGYSIYNSGEDADNRRVFVNTNPYYARTADGQWISGEANSTAYGVGLHIYGSYNDVTQAADLLSSGLYGIGIRVDGAGNVIRVGSDTRVSADGKGGIGLLVAYGKGHEVNVAGTVTATGEGGNAVEFNFGDNNLGNQNGYRGSYIQARLKSDNATKDEDDTNGGAGLRDELKGALVDNFNLTGTLVGAGNAIYISRNAYVHNINIQNGASITGDISSDWDYDSPLIYSGYKFSDTGDPLLTNLNFGVTYDKDGNQVADDDFSFTYDGVISGGDSFVINFKGGTTNLGLNSESGVSAMAVTVAEGATLNTSGNYTLNKLSSSTISSSSEFKDVSFGTFDNSGTVAIGGRNIGALTLTSGDFYTGATGTLALQFSTTATDTLTATTGSVALDTDSTITLNAAQDYYTDGFTRTMSLNGDFITVDAGTLASAATLPDEYLNSAILTAYSPTLLQTLTVTDDGTSDAVYTVSLTRTAGNTYSRFGSGDSNATAIGQAFDAMAANAPSALRSAIASMDFSGSDGSGITQALDSMVPAAFNAAVNGVLSHQTFLNDQGQDHLQKQMRLSPGNYVYADPYLIRGRRGSGLYTVDKEHDFGVIAGLDKVNDGSLCGVYLNLNNRSQKTKNKFSIRDKSLYAGIRGVKSLNEDKTLSAFGDARVGADFIEQDRYVSFYDYQEKLDADYTAYGAAAYGGIAYELALSEFTLNFAADLAWSYLRTPGIAEGGGALALYLEQGDFNSLKAGLGVSMSLPESVLENGGRLGFSGTLRYHREILDDAGSYDAAFRGAPYYGFEQTVDHQGKDSIYASVDGTYKYQNLVLGAALGGEFYQGEGREIFGRVNLEWKF